MSSSPENLRDFLFKIFFFLLAVCILIIIGGATVKENEVKIVLCIFALVIYLCACTIFHWLEKSID